mmetsp:Transcript_36188/g.95203  ORF Transcript_36188/g.95203 Transcript_36188/m.95203 type:complete len:525 (-) Transcript_36188:259-1833(-)
MCTTYARCEVSPCKSSPTKLKPPFLVRNISDADGQIRAHACMRLTYDLQEVDRRRASLGAGMSPTSGRAFRAARGTLLTSSSRSSSSTPRRASFAGTPSGSETPQRSALLEEDEEEANLENLRKQVRITRTIGAASSEARALLRLGRRRLQLASAAREKLYDGYGNPAANELMNDQEEGADGDPLEAAAIVLGRAAELCRRVGDPEGGSVARNLRGVARGAQGMHREALSEHRKALAMAQAYSRVAEAGGIERDHLRGGASPAEVAASAAGEALYGMAVALRALGDYEGAAKLLALSVDASQAARDTAAAGRACGEQGSLLYESGDYEGSLKQHIAWMRAAEDSGEMMFTYNPYKRNVTAESTPRAGGGSSRSGRPPPPPAAFSPKPGMIGSLLTPSRGSHRSRSGSMPSLDMATAVEDLRSDAESANQSAHNAAASLGRVFPTLGRASEYMTEFDDALWKIIMTPSEEMDMSNRFDDDDDLEDPRLRDGPGLKAANRWRGPRAFGWSPGERFVNMISSQLVLW